MVACPYCESTVLLDDEAVRLAGKGGVMAEEPSLLVLGRRVEHGGETYLPVGHARFAYPQGWWDEFWAIDGAGEGVWISVDEGDIAIEEDIDEPTQLSPSDLKLGADVTFMGERFRVTEANTGTLAALRGEFPEEMSVGDSFEYWHLSGPRQRLVTVEIEDGVTYATEGRWIDPFDIRAAAVAEGDAGA